MRIVLKSKIYYATITDLKLYYQGSITIDERVMKEADLKEGEKVDVLNLNNGNRFETYVIKGRKNSGAICLNGPAARLGLKGDKVIILSYGLYTDEEIKKIKVRFVELDEKNRIKTTYLVR